MRKNEGAKALTSEERLLLRRFRSLDGREKTLLFRYLDGEPEEKAPSEADRKRLLFVTGFITACLVLYMCINLLG